MIKMELTRNISGEAVPAEDPLAPSACAALGWGAWVHSAVRVSLSSATSRTRSSGSRIPPELARSARTPTHVSGPWKEDKLNLRFWGYQVPLHSDWDEFDRFQFRRTYILFSYQWTKIRYPPLNVGLFFTLLAIFYRIKLPRPCWESTWRNNITTT